MLCELGGKTEFLELVINERLLAEWAELGSSHAVTQCELLPALASRLVWADRLQLQDFLHFTDNAAVKDILVKGSSFGISKEELALNRTQRMHLVEARQMNSIRS